MNPDARVVYRIAERDGADATFFIFVNGRGYTIRASELHQTPYASDALYELLADEGTLFITDGDVGITYADLRLSATMIQIVSPDYNRFHGFEKEGRAFRLYMPLWTDDELEACRVACFPAVDAEQVASRSEVFGDIPRVVFADDDQYSKYRNRLDTAVRSPGDVGSCFEMIQKLNADEPRQYDKMSHVLVHLQPRRKVDTKNPVPLSSVYFCFASEYVTKAVRSVMGQYMRDKYAEFVRYSSHISGLSVLRGNFFEVVAHELVAREPREYNVRVLNREELAGAELEVLLSAGFWQSLHGDFVISPEPRLETSLGNTQAVAAVTVSQYGRPSSKTFPSVDGMILLHEGSPLSTFLGTRYLFLQMTINREHGVKWYYLRQMMDACGTKLAALMFVCTDEEAPSFPKQRMELKVPKKRNETVQHALVRPIDAGYNVVQCVLSLPMSCLKRLPEPEPEPEA